MISQSLSQKQQQKMSPRQIQLMKLLQIPTFALDQRIKEEMEINPALEYDEHAESREESYNESEPEGSKENNEVDFEEYFPEYTHEDSDYRSPSDGYNSENEFRPQIADNSLDLQTFLEQQLEMVDFANENDYVIGKQIIGSLDEDGYLRREPVSITDDLLFTQGLNISESDVLAVLSVIQTFEPKGVASLSLQQCLLIQLDDRILNFEGNDMYRLADLHLARIIIAEYFDEFAKKHFQKLVKNLEVDEDELKSAYDEILKLNPKPASDFSSSGNSETSYIEPDFIIQNKDGVLEMHLNSRNAPDLRISEAYKDMLRTIRRNKAQGSLTRSDKETALFVKQKIESAQTFIESIKKRQSTLYETMKSIMKIQYDYFLTGDTKYLKPMILKDIAEMIGVDISTVSRVANSKYVQTEFGTKLLKDFFSESIQNSDGEEISTIEVKKILVDLINVEDKALPLSDEKLMELLGEKGYTLSRRTVAKYREKLNIPVARLRKELV